MNPLCVQLLAGATLLLSACASEPGIPVPLPIAPERGPTLEAIAASQSIDLTKPLSGDAVATVAVYTNPDLIALRTSEGVADAQVFAAGLYPDPSFSFGIDVPLNGVDTTAAIAFGADFDFAALARRPSAMRGAQANLDAVRLDIAWSEWLTGEQARFLATRVVYLRGIKTLTAQLRTLADAEVARALPAVARGDLPAAALETSRLGAADAADRDRTTELQLQSAMLDLNQLLGLDPTQELKLAPPHNPVASIPSDKALFQCALMTRADLAAVRAAYEIASATLDTAELGRYPLPSLGINAARDTSDIRSIGPSVSFTLPLWNRGRGDIAIARANQEQLRANYSARLATLRADVAAARAALLITRQQQADVARELEPLFPLAEANERAAERGDLSLAVAIATRMSLLDKQIVDAGLMLSIAELTIALEISAGRPLETIE